MSETDFGIGQPVRRVEDDRFLRGEGCYIGDIDLPQQAYLHVVRSPHANARIRSIFTDDARAAPGVLDVLTGAEYAVDGLGTPVIDFPVFPGSAFRFREGTILRLPANSLLATERVRHVGDRVAIVVAESRTQALDASELITVDYDPLPSVTGTEAALAHDAPSVWEDIPDNLCADVEYGDEAACDDVFYRAYHVAKINLVNNRVIVNPLEPRGAIGAFDEASGVYTIYTNSQVPHGVRTMLAQEVFGLPEEKIRVICPDMGGGFGGRGAPSPECALVLWCARRLGRPIKWICDRSEGFVSDTQGRDNVTHAELALDRDGRFLALRASTIAGTGAYPGRVGLMVPIMYGPRVQTNIYMIPSIYLRIRVAYTNTISIAPYRGAGQPEAVYAIERLIEIAARGTGIDAIELRRRNQIPSAAMPYTNAIGVTYDSGEYEANLRQAMVLSHWEGFETRKADSLARGLLRGRGVANFIQVAAGVPIEWGALHVRADGRVDLYSGTHNHGQGHETSFAQVIVEQLGVPLRSINLIQGDTDRVKRGQGTYGSRSMMLVGPLIVTNAEEIVAKAKRIAANKFEAAESDVLFERGRITVAGTDLSLDLFEAASISERDETLPEDLKGGLFSESDYTAKATFPSGTHICEVEVDEETGLVRIVRFSAIDDVGRAINPLILFGQSHGGIAQGVGQALLEDCRYDPGSGQLLSGSLMDYCLPRADDLPAIEVDLHEALSPTNPLGIKGAGENGSTGAPPAVINAIVDALSYYDLSHVDMPATSERVWRAIWDVKRKETTPQ